jgi:hypothetical protein
MIAMEVLRRWMSPLLAPGGENLNVDYPQPMSLFTIS